MNQAAAFGDEDAEFEYDDEFPVSYHANISDKAVKSVVSKPNDPIVYAYRIEAGGRRILEYQIARRKDEPREWRKALSLLGHDWSVAIEKSVQI